MIEKTEQIDSAAEQELPATRLSVTDFWLSQLHDPFSPMHSRILPAPQPIGVDFDVLSLYPTSYRPTLRNSQ